MMNQGILLSVRIQASTLTQLAEFFNCDIFKALNLAISLDQIELFCVKINDVLPCL